MKYYTVTRDALVAFYYSHIQATLGTLTVALAGFDLVGYHDSVAAFTGEKGYHAIRLCIGGLIVWRAYQVSSEKISG